ncbi:MAG: hypothetical protein ACUVT4_09355 [Actinomycetota bacterium]
MEMLHLVEGPRAELEELKPPAKAEPFHREPLDFYDLCQRELEELLSTVSFSREVLGVMTEPTEAARGFSEDPPQSKRGVLQGLDDLEKAYRESLRGLEKNSAHTCSRSIGAKDRSIVGASG